MDDASRAGEVISLDVDPRSSRRFSDLRHLNVALDWWRPDGPCPGRPVSGRGAGSEPAAPAEETTRAAAEDRPFYIFLNGPADIESLWKSLERPDFILSRGADPRKPPEGARATPSPVGPWVAVVRSVAVRGEVAGDLANLSIELSITMMVPVRRGSPCGSTTRRP